MTIDHDHEQGHGLSHEGHEHAFENEHRPIETLMAVCSAPTVRMQTTQPGLKLACQFTINLKLFIFSIIVIHFIIKAGTLILFVCCPGEPSQDAAQI